ncbi:hypothetical protein [Nocardia sp. NPDC019255]|uniref:hypothetical protein n=1 Tax=Nocardia sp. NPDC019255 TaxID=3154591 RepID=UPI0033C06AA1
MFRLVVDSWPTENGQPFFAQGFDYWAEIVHAHRAGEPLPTWLPSDLWRWIDDGPAELVEKSGYVIADYDPPDYASGYPGFSERLITVPHATARRYFSRSSLVGRLNDLRAWGCEAHIERAPIGEWEAS